LNFIPIPLPGVAEQALTERYPDDEAWGCGDELRDVAAATQTRVVPAKAGTSGEPSAPSPEVPALGPIEVLLRWGPFVGTTMFY
jgi:hypothetical protein